jgi:hypothetical protein
MDIESAGINWQICKDCELVAVKYEYCYCELHVKQNYEKLQKRFIIFHEYIPASRVLRRVFGL